MMLVFSIFFVLLVTFFVLLWLGWERIPVSFLKNQLEGVSIIIPVRNEAGTIGPLLRSLNDQAFSKHKMEVLVIDDHSEDDTVREVRKASMDCQFAVKCIQLSADQYGKKIASTVGNEHAKFDIVLCTDGDTQVSKNWIATMTGPIVHRQMQMVSGPVKMQGTNFFESLQMLEFAGLIGVGAFTLYRGIPTMCNGANMAYRNSAFTAVNGYLDNMHIPSGDDEFLLRKIHKQFPKAICFVKSPDALVSTSTKPSYRSLWDQRVRWISKWRFHQSTITNLLASLSFLTFLSFGIFLISWLVINPLMFLSAYALLVITVGTYLYSMARFMRVRFQIVPLLGLVFIYPYYAVVLGLASIFGSYSWKGRRYR